MQANQQSPFDLLEGHPLQTNLGFPDEGNLEDLDTLYITALNAVMPKEVGPGIYYGLSNDQYHSGPGISKSGLDWVEKNPSQLIWSQNAPRDQEKEKALDFGTAVHTLLLEPELFDTQFVVAPELNLRTNDGKAEWASFQEANQDRTIMTLEEHRKLMIMRDSVLAHPVAKAILEAQGYNEASIYWTDKETGELCRVRPDRVIDWHGQPVIVDVKKVAGLDRFEKHVAEFRYHVQDAMYREGYKAHFGVEPLFWFFCVSDVASAGKYEVEVVQIPSDWQDDGYLTFRSNLNEYARCKRENDWLHVREINRPHWALR